jgi:flavin reductase ActVB
VPIDQGSFRQAMTRFPSGVTIVTMVDDSNQRWGFTASAFTSLSLAPPLVLVCLDRAANCYSSFCDTERFAINILGADHEALARRFATKGIDKFEGVDFQPGEFQLPLLSDAVVTLECQRSALMPGGDHVILIGEPLSIRLGNGTPAVLFDRRFWRFLEASSGVRSNGSSAGQRLLTTGKVTSGNGTRQSG